MFLILRAVRSLVILLLPLFLLGGCATNNPRDPLEPMNRVIYKVNDGVDKVIVRPLAEGFRFILPQFVRNSISNFFANINDILIALNNLLQGKVTAALSDLGRFAVNTTVGLAGLLDPASSMGLEKHNEDFGQTLGRWGVDSGPYLVLPFLGPSSVRDGIGRLVDFKTDPLGYLNDIPWRNSLWGTRFISNRAELLDTTRILETAALDPYEFVRDAYLQRRRNLVYDGSPPREKDDDAQNAPADAPADKRADSPFPRVAGEPPAAPGTPAHQLGARSDEPTAAAQLPAAPAVQEKSQIEIKLPTEPTGAGPSTYVAAPVPERAPSPRVARIWLAPLSIDAAH